MGARRAGGHVSLREMRLGGVVGGLLIQYGQELVHIQFFVYRLRGTGGGTGCG